MTDWFACLHVCQCLLAQARDIKMYSEQWYALKRHESRERGTHHADEDASARRETPPCGPMEPRGGGEDAVNSGAAPATTSTEQAGDQEDELAGMTEEEIVQQIMEEESAIKVQAAWRGHRVRQAVTRVHEPTFTF
jgi:hypothetical protein